MILRRFSFLCTEPVAKWKLQFSKVPSGDQVIKSVFGQVWNYNYDPSSISFWNSLVDAPSKLSKALNTLTNVNKYTVQVPLPSQHNTTSIYLPTIVIKTKNKRSIQSQISIMESYIEKVKQAMKDQKLAKTLEYNIQEDISPQADKQNTQEEASQSTLDKYKTKLPIQLQENLDNHASLYGRETIQNQLADAACLGNPRAYYHLARCFENSFFDLKPYEDFIASLFQIAEKGAKQYNDYVLQSWMTISKNDKIKILEKSAIDDPEALFSLAVLKRKYEDAMPLLQKAESLGYKRAKIEIARRQMTSQDCYDYLLKVSESEHLAEGYFMAGVMLERGQAKDEMQTFKDLYELAGKYGRTQAYLSVMAIKFEKGDYKAVEELATTMKQKDDPSGFRVVGDWYRAAGDLAKAKQSYHEAGPFEGFIPELAVTAEKEQTKLKEEATQYLTNHFQSIKKRVEISEYFNESVM